MTRKLQQELLQNSDEHFKSVKDTVQQELENYSSVLTKNFSSVLSLTNVEAVVRKVVVCGDMSKN